MPFSTSKNQIIRKSNELIEARYKLNVAEQRLVLLLASEISPEDEDFKDYEIRVADFAKMFGLQTDKSLYEKVQNSADSLISRTLQLSTDINTSRKTAWLSYVEYVKGSGIVKLRFDKSLKPYFLQLKGYYTQYQLNHVMNFKSQYSMRLYELLKMEAFKVNKYGQFEKYFELQEYRDLLGIEKKAYPVFADFRKYVIQPVVSEVSDKTDLIINDVKYGKTGRKFTNITFSVGVRSEQDTKLRQANLRLEDIKPEKESENHTIIDKLVSLGFPLEAAKKCKNKHPIGLIERNIAYTLAKKVDNIPAYLNNAIENDYAGGAWEAENKKKEEAKQEQIKLEKERIAKEAKAEKERLEKKAMYQKAFDTFLELPIEKQEELKSDFLKNADDITAKKARESLNKGEDFFKSAIVVQNFKSYLVKNGF
jgi:plasmid replication initiation protein